MVIFKDNSAVHAHINRQVYANELEKASDVISTLKNFAEVSQSGAVEILKANPRTASAFKTFWISNTMFIDGADAVTINHLVSLPEVLEVREQKIAHINPVIVNKVNADPAPLAEWGIEITNADLVHQSGNTGEGVVVSSIDTGVRYTHEALVGNYLNNGYSWYDPYTGSRNPIDENGHGTHTMGTVAGSMGIGMAPGSKWMACRGCDTSSCTEFALTSCGEFIACPTSSSGGSCDVSKKPHVVNNSWGGGQGDTWYDSIIEAWIAVGIVPVFSNGNSGSFCGSANSPADNPRVIGVGSTVYDDTLSYFSSRGPTVRGEVKPDISAPGSDVRSSYYTSDTAYSSLSGTSMAGPHVAGAVALLLADNPNLTLAQVKSALYDNAERNLGSGGGACDGLSESVFPNHSFGYGRLDILASIGKK
jgi:subtilisin family serine protease